MIEQFHFIRPWLLLVLPAGGIMIFLLWKRTGEDTNWNKICDAHLMKHLLIGKRNKKIRLPYFGWVAAWVFASIALAGPTWEKTPEKLFEPTESRVIVFDLSLSMGSSDIKPTRLERARYKLTDLIASGKGLQQGLIVFAGDAFIVAPLTDDAGTIINLIPALNLDTVPVQGSRADLGLDLAATLYKNAGFTNKNIILMTDGADERALDAASRLSKNGFQISMLAVGTAQGGPVTLADGSLLKDNSGNIIIPSVDISLLRQISEKGNGQFSVMTNEDSDIERLNDRTLAIKNAKNSNGEESLLKSDQWKDIGPWLLIPVLFIASLGFRRGWLVGLLLAFLPLMPVDSYAFGWENLWKRSDQIAAEKFKSGEFDQIDEGAPVMWKGAAKYRKLDFEGALEEYGKADPENAATHFNSGNALAHNQAYEEAIASYDKTLEIEPDNEDAKFNKELVEKRLEQKQNQQNDNQSDNAQQNPQEESDNAEQENQQKQGQDSSAQGDSERELERESERNDQARAEAQKNKNAQAASQSEKDENEDEEFQGSNKNSDTEVQAQKNQINDERLSEQQQAMEQWLQKVPDDPGGLLKRKFAYQYSLRTDSLRSAIQQEKRW